MTELFSAFPSGYWPVPLLVMLCVWWEMRT